eukprot:5020587-Amphidinium_carterae.1
MRGDAVCVASADIESKLALIEVSLFSLEQLILHESLSEDHSPVDLRNASSNLIQQLKSQEAEHPNIHSGIVFQQPTVFKPYETNSS